MALANRVALITGAADGIGKAIATRLLEKGIKGVGLIDINEDKAKVTVKTLSSRFGNEKVLYVHGDVSSKDQFEGAFEKIKSHFNGLNIVCNNAAITDEINWDHMVDVNLKGVIRGTYLAVQHMGTQNGGSGGAVVNIASVNGFLPNRIVPTYAATKHGIVGFTRSSAEEPLLKENGVRVNAVCPGVVDTQMIIDIEEKGCRYKELYAERKGLARRVPIANVVEATIKFIEDSSYNGVTCAVVPDDPMLVVEPPKITVI
ncbi:15-hydroxyprostaglandin dehydrogenase [NAD(+)]-like [Ptychodera flava]|uniref:15-hydroxyprostaglandin dehydrogenase [NAD(+)]-like n=1 Tax=Ptychodera flava TaxID=63121 RepID=UPI00396AA36F